MIEVQVDVSATLKEIWQYWNEPTHIEKWNSASDDWHTLWPMAEE